MKVSVLTPYFQGRRALLERTLWLLRQQTYDDYEVWILDDGSDENIEEICGGRIVYKRVRGTGASPRASNMAWHYGYEDCDGEFVILAHPEYMAPLDAIERLVEQYDGSARLEPVPLALPPKGQAIIDSVDWKNDLDLLQTLPEFWTFKTPWGWTNFEAKEWCHHFAFTGQTRDAWDVNDFLPVTEELGMNDSWLVKLEVEQGRPPVCADFSVYHQHHERTADWPWPERSARVKRIMESGG
jgi:glycosyltransferase involved in cell wall biosynthesis